MKSVEDFGNDDLFGSTEISLDEVCDNSKQTSWITFKGGKPDPYVVILYNNEKLKSSPLRQEVQLWTSSKNSHTMRKEKREKEKSQKQ